MNGINKVLIVDDDDMTSYLTERAIRQMGVVVPVDTALNGKEALNFLRANDSPVPPGMTNIILLDLNMPVMNGAEFLDAYANEQFIAKAHTRIILFTSTPNGDNTRRAMQHPLVIGCIGKPFSEESFRQIMDRYKANEYSR